MIWKPIIYKFCVAKSWSRDQRERAIISHTWSLHLWNNFHNVWRFYRKKYPSVTINPASFTTITPCSSLGNFSPHHRTFSRHLHFHIPCYFHCASHSTLTLLFFWFSLPFLSLTLELKLYGIFSPYSEIRHSNNFEHSSDEWHGACDIKLPPWKPWFD